jgi:hypothetical protein
MLIHKELAWIFLHKIGGFTDDANTYYKRKLAYEWTIVLGPPPKKSGADRDRAKAIQKYVDWLRAISDAPQSLADCVQQEPAVAPLLDRLHAEVGVTINSADEAFIFLMNLERVRAISKSLLHGEWEKGMGPKTKALEAIITDPANDKALTALTTHLRKRLVVERYHMEPERMIRYTQKYGPIDWRHHAAHSLYWSARGVEMGEKRVTRDNKLDFDFVNTDRVVAQSVQDLFRTGELYFDFLQATRTNSSFFQGVPNPHFVESYIQIVDQEMRQRSEFDKSVAEGGYGRIYSPLSAGYENFIRDVIVFYYRRGQRDQAIKWQQNLLTYIHLNLNDPGRGKEIEKPIDEFVNSELQDNMTRPSMMVQQVSGALMGAFASGLLGQDPEQFAAQVDYAKKAHRYFMEEQIRRTPAGGQINRMEQIEKLFDRLAGGMFYQFVAQLDIDDAQTAYAQAPDTLRRYAYAPIRENFKDILDKSGGKKFDEVFPQPLGYDKFLAELRADMEEEQRRQNEAGKIEQK